MVFTRFLMRGARTLATLRNRLFPSSRGLRIVTELIARATQASPRSAEMHEPDDERLRAAERAIDARAAEMAQQRDAARVLRKARSWRAYFAAKKRARAARASWLDEVRHLAKLHLEAGLLKNDFRRLHQSTRFDPVRISWSVLPGWTQPVFTAVSGMPLPGEVPNAVTRWSVLHPLSMALAAITLATVSPVLLPLAWLFVGSTVRTLDGVGRHHGAHGRFFVSLDRRLMPRDRRWNHWLAETMAFLLLAGPIAGYRRDHVRDHHARQKTGTLEDPDTKTVAREEFTPGVASDRQWKRLLRKIVDPRFYGRFWMRLREPFEASVPFGRRLLSVAYLATLLALPDWAPSAAQVVLPGLILIYPLTVLFEFVSEHFHYRPSDAPAERVTFGRFFGEPLPTTVLARFRWIARWPRYLLAKLLIGQGDLSNHDLHHFRPGTDWRTHGFVRHAFLERGLKFTQAWGDLSSLSRVVFDAMAELAPLTDEERRSLQ